MQFYYLNETTLEIVVITEEFRQQLIDIAMIVNDRKWFETLSTLAVAKV